MHIAIVTSGTPCPPDFARWLLETCTAIIAVDGGIQLLIDLGIRPGLFVGDLDSSGPDVPACLNVTQSHRILKTAIDQNRY
jgi:thiamine pyrophosphokinase